jgi:glutamate synthase (NADPH) large chain
LATQNPELRAKFSGDPDNVVYFMRFIAEEVRELMAELGFRTVNEMIGHTEVIVIEGTDSNEKTKHLDFSKILHQVDVPESFGRYQQTTQNLELEKTLDETMLLGLCKPTLEKGEAVIAELEIRNVNRAVGTILGSEISKKYGAEGLPDETIQLKFKGSAGQSFGAFVPKGITLTLEGDSNDYIGKGLSGGKIIVYPPKTSDFVASENVIIGNTAFYGATAGEAYISGIAGERFAVRNSGVNAVIEGVGDHGCEYMTGGTVIVLGKTGKNFAAGMSGGIAYVYDEKVRFPSLCNKEMIELGKIDDQDEIEFVKKQISRHIELTQSILGREILRNWEENRLRFVRVIPNDYKRAIDTQKRFIIDGQTKEEAEMSAFYANAA